MKQTMIKLCRRFALPMMISIAVFGVMLPATTFAASAQSNTTCGKNDVQCVITVGNQLIAERLQVLTTLSNRVNERLEKGAITSDQASVLQSDISTNETGLNSLKTTLDAEQSAQAARQDVANIFTQFRIYVVVLPRDYRTIHVDIASNIDNKMKGIEPKLQQIITDASSNEQQKLQSLYTDFTNQVSAAATQIDTAQSGLPALTPSSYNYNHATYIATLASVTAADRAAHGDLHQAAGDLHQIYEILHG